MITNDNLLWNIDEYQSVVDYKGNSYSAINVLLSDNVTMREKDGKMKILPKTKEEFEKILRTTIYVYSAIRKAYVLNGSKPYSKKIFRGGRDGKVDSSFLSTSDSLMTAFDFAKGHAKVNEGLLLVMESGNVPYINIGKYIYDDYVTNNDGEPEILFLPCESKNPQEISFFDCFEIAKKQGERILGAEAYIRKFGSLKCRQVELSELDYSKEKSTLSEEDLCMMFSEYQKNLETIRNTDQNSEEYKKAYQQILQFKKNCCTWLHQKFYEINQSIDNQINIENNDIQVSEDHDMKEVSIGNTGDMYLVQDKVNNEEYYFKPAISKSGAERPYRANIQEAGYLIQRIINPENAVKCNVTTINGMYGAIQQKIPVDSQATKTFIEYFNKGKGTLSPEMIKQILNEYLVDFCLCNYDAHANNFIVDENGKLRGIDKEQSFRYIKDDAENDMTFSVNYNERYGEEPTIYNILFEQMKQGLISYEYLEILKYRASRLAQYPDEQYRKIFKEYAYGKAKTPEEAETLLSSILERKKDILQRVEQLRNEIFQEWYKNDKITERATQASKSEKSQEKKTIPMKAVVSNAITQGIATEDVTQSDNVEHKEIQIYTLKGVTKDD